MYINALITNNIVFVKIYIVEAIYEL